MNHPLISPRQEIVSLLRGYIACSLLSCLGETGRLDRMLDGPFAAEDVSPRPAVAIAVLHYLVSLGLIVPAADRQGAFETTRLGQSVFRRSGVFNLLHSYYNYFANLKAMLAGASENPAVNRSLDIFGSGRLHGRKFFPALTRFRKFEDLSEHSICRTGALTTACKAV